MWPRRILMSAVVVVLVLAVTALAGLDGQQASFVTAGQVRITTAPDRLSALVSVEAERSGGPDGVVERAFLLQATQPLDVAFEGPATLVFTASRLIVMKTPDIGWVFSVMGKDAEPMAVAPALTFVPVVGLAYYWGRSIDVTHEELATQLFARLCEQGGEDERGPGCESCASGGPGEMGCEITCPDGTCSVSCGHGYYACCKCPDGCRCCRDIEQRPMASPLPTGRK